MRWCPHDDMDVGADDAWADDTGRYVRILCFRIEGLGVLVWVLMLTRSFLATI